MEFAVRLVGSYRERDKLIRLLHYICRFLSGAAQTSFGKKLALIASELGSCRTVLRLFDDIPMLSHTLRYGLGSKEENQWLRRLEITGNIANQLFYPLEHIAWFAKHKIIDRDPAPWAVWCIRAWAVSLSAEILKAFTRVVLIRRAQAKLIKEAEVEGKGFNEIGEMHVSTQDQLRILKSQELHCYLAILENGTDFVNAINWMPSGFLWSGTLSNRIIGLMGTISSFIKLVRIHNPPLVTGKRHQ